ncbi:MAG: hypothetical protein IJZ38_04950 [Bacteroides sp.]|nr:hypothetical protein [Bacteroides sp.]
MKRMFVNLMCVLAMACIAMPSFAQNEQDMLRRRAAEKVGQMCDYIEFMANPQNGLSTRKYYCDKALNLFINRGNEYEENGILKKGVLMEVTSVNRNKTFPKLIKTYFVGLMNLTYDAVQISSTEVAEMRVSNLQKVKDNLYVCTCYFEQVFAGYRDGRAVYKDITRKRVKCYVQKEQTEDGAEYVVMLGDVTAIDTKRI